MLGSGKLSRESASWGKKVDETYVPLGIFPKSFYCDVAQLNCTSP